MRENHKKKLKKKKFQSKAVNRINCLKYKELSKERKKKRKKESLTNRYCPALHES